jgi:hypothetical protein
LLDDPSIISEMNRSGSLAEVTSRAALGLMTLAMSKATEDECMSSVDRCQQASRAEQRERSVAAAPRITLGMIVTYKLRPAAAAVSAALTSTEAGNCIGIIVSRVVVSGCSGQTGTLKKELCHQEGRIGSVSTFGKVRCSKAEGDTGTVQLNQRAMMVHRWTPSGPCEV